MPNKKHKKIKMTAKELARLKKKLKKLQTEKRREVAEKIHEAAEQGDISDSFDYEEAKREQGFVEGKILELKQKINRAEVLKEKDINKGDKVQVGNVVTLELGGEEQKFRIIGAGKSEPQAGTLSYNSPLGQALLGRSQGETFEFQAPKGKIKAEIRAID